MHFALSSVDSGTVEIQRLFTSINSGTVEIQIDWNEMPEEDIDPLILSIHVRVQECIQFRGRQINY